MLNTFKHRGETFVIKYNEKVFFLSATYYLLGGDPGVAGGGELTSYLEKTGWT